MSAEDDLLDANLKYAHDGFAGPLPLAPARHLAIVACMDSRMPIFAILGLRSGEAHILRNAGGVVTDDVIRSLIISQRLMGTREIVLVHHTDCGLTKISEDTLRAELERDTGIRPRFAFESFQDPYADVRQSIRRLQTSPFLKYRDRIRGFVYDVSSGLLREVEPPDASVPFVADL
ncbi:MAG: carbonic anhydrase [Planctomycetota bacterium]|nr:carbonic anhydrase [Planctomycetota bacterium]